MTDVLQVRGTIRPLESRSEPGWAELRDALRELLDGADPADRVIGLRQLKSRVYRLELEPDAPWRSVVIKRMEPAIAQRSQLVAERWLPALGLSDACARLLGVAAERNGTSVWHIYEDLGDGTLAAHPDADRVNATVDLIADLHSSAAEHAILPDVRRYSHDLGMPYYRSNVRDAIAALEALRYRGVKTPPEHAGLPERLLERLQALLAEAPRRAQVFDEEAGPETFLHGDLWTINAFVVATAGGPRARLVDWDRAGVGPFSYDLSTFLFRFPPPERPGIVELYRRAAARAGRCLPSLAALKVLCDTAERARYANCVIWPALALLREEAGWGFPGLAEVERWFHVLDSERPL